LIGRCFLQHQFANLPPGNYLSEAILAARISLIFNYFKQGANDEKRTLGIAFDGQYKPETNSGYPGFFPWGVDGRRQPKFGQG
jgi:hypothetical protein